MHLLITGGTGFIGTPLCAMLIGGGHQVTVLSRDPTRHSARLPQVQLVNTLENDSSRQLMRSSTWLENLCWKDAGTNTLRKRSARRGYKRHADYMTGLPLLPLNSVRVG